MKISQTPDYKYLRYALNTLLCAASFEKSPYKMMILFTKDAADILCSSKDSSSKFSDSNVTCECLISSKVKRTVHFWRLVFGLSTPLSQKYGPSRNSISLRSPNRSWYFFFSHLTRCLKKFESKTRNEHLACTNLPFQIYSICLKRNVNYNRSEVLIQGIQIDGNETERTLSS